MRYLFILLLTLSCYGQIIIYNQCVGQTAEVPLEFDYTDSAATVYIYSIDTDSTISLIDSLETETGLTYYTKTVNIEYDKPTSFFAKAVRRFKSAKIYSKRSNKTLFIPTVDGVRIGIKE